MSNLDRARELACLVLRLDIRDFNNDESLDEALNKGLINEYSIDLFHFHQLIDRLLEFTPIQYSSLTGIEYYAFVYKGMAIYKKEVEF